jgi:ankyrin repeat protein
VWRRHKVTCAPASYCEFPVNLAGRPPVTPPAISNRLGIAIKPLLWASEHAPATVRVLLERGADVNSRNRKADSEFHGMTPLIMNAPQKDDCSEVAELLIAAGADLAAVDANGKTALSHAREHGLTRMP